jgi:hypothetical protein
LENFSLQPLKSISRGLAMTMDFLPSTNETNGAGELKFPLASPETDWDPD